MVTKLNRKSLREQRKSGYHNEPRKDQEVALVVHSARLCVTSLQREKNNFFQRSSNGRAEERSREEREKQARTRARQKKGGRGKDRRKNTRDKKHKTRRREVKKR